MNNKVRALLVYSGTGSMPELQRMLTNQFLKTTHARSCRQAVAALKKPDPPHLVFTDPELLDGTWAEILEAATSAPVAVNVILVVQADQIKRYAEAMQRGMFDIIAPPFSEFDVAHLLKNAVTKVLSRRDAALSASSRMFRALPA